MAKNTPQRKGIQKGKAVYRTRPSRSVEIYAHNVSAAEKALVDARDIIKKRNELFTRIIVSK